MFNEMAKLQFLPFHGQQRNLKNVETQNLASLPVYNENPILTLTVNGQRLLTTTFLVAVLPSPSRTFTKYCPAAKRVTSTWTWFEPSFSFV